MAERGRAFCGRLPGRTEAGAWPSVPNALRVAAYSGSNQRIGPSGPHAWTLSPMILGPVVFRGLDGGRCEDATVAMNIENAWQASKVYEGDVGDDGLPNAAWFKRRAKFFADPRGHRRTAPRGTKCLYSWFGGAQVDYLTSRRIFYVPLFAAFAAATPAFRALEAVVAAGGDVLIIGPDGRDVPPTAAAHAAALADTVKPYGHELVLAAMLNRVPLPIVSNPLWASPPPELLIVSRPAKGLLFFQVPLLLQK